MPQEYQRQCLACGKVWHSLASREKEIEKLNKTNNLEKLGGSLQAVGSCGMCGTGKVQAAQLKMDGNNVELSRLRSCPQCGSANFNERIIDHSKPPQQIPR
jgi:DNA-directed RNA polymerase subunit M/transcription elongation factor TFIIS